MLGPRRLLNSVSRPRLVSKASSLPQSLYFDQGNAKPMCSKEGMLLSALTHLYRPLVGKERVGGQEAWAPGACPPRRAPGLYRAPYRLQLLRQLPASVSALGCGQLVPLPSDSTFLLLFRGQLEPKVEDHD